MAPKKESIKVIIESHHDNFIDTEKAINRIFELFGVKEKEEEIPGTVFVPQKPKMKR